MISRVINTCQYIVLYYQVFVIVQVLPQTVSSGSIKGEVAPAIQDRLHRLVYKHHHY
jgi:hypothetical protein